MGAESKSIRDPLPPECFGRDHFTVLLYVEAVVTTCRGYPSLVKMRCDPHRHPGLAHVDPMNDSLLHDGSKFPTRLKGGVEQSGHDDRDCFDDLSAAGWVENVGTGVDTFMAHDVRRLPRRRLLRTHQAQGGYRVDFDLAEAEATRGGGGC